MAYLNNLGIGFSVLMSTTRNILDDLQNATLASTLLNDEQKTALFNILEINYNLKSDGRDSILAIIKEMFSDIQVKSWDELGQPGSILGNLDTIRSDVYDIWAGYLTAELAVVESQIANLLTDIPGNFYPPA